MAMSPVSSEAASAEPMNSSAAQHPDGDLRHADAAHAQQFAGQQIAGLGHGQHHLKDARGLLFDDRAGHVQTVKHDGHGEQKQHESRFDDGGASVALADLSVLVQLQCLDGNLGQHRVGLGLAHALADHALIDDAAIQGVCRPPLSKTSATESEVIGGRDLFRIGGIDGQHAVDCLGAHLPLQLGALARGCRRDHIHLVLGVLVVEQSAGALRRPERHRRPRSRCAFRYWPCGPCNS